MVSAIYKQCWVSSRRVTFYGIDQVYVYTFGKIYFFRNISFIYVDFS